MVDAVQQNHMILDECEDDVIAEDLFSNNDHESMDGTATTDAIRMEGDQEEGSGDEDLYNIANLDDDVVRTQLEQQHTRQKLAMCRSKIHIIFLSMSSLCVSPTIFNCALLAEFHDSFR